MARCRPGRVALLLVALQMRAAPSRFTASEYAAHCTSGGHPTRALGCSGRAVRSRSTGRHVADLASTSIGCVADRGCADALATVGIESAPGRLKSSVTR